MATSSYNDGYGHRVIHTMLSEWFPAHILKYVERVHQEIDLCHMCTLIKIEFINGAMSLPLRVEPSASAVVEPIEVISSDEYFGQWQAHALMAAGPML